MAAVTTGQPWRPILARSIAGDDVPPRPETAKGRRPGRKRARAKRARLVGAWREAQGRRCYVIDAERSGQVLSWHQVQTDSVCNRVRKCKSCFARAVLN
jgi:hypothetical protein